MKPPAAGVYHYWLDDQLQPIVEPWHVAAEDAGVVLRGERRIGDASVLAVEARYRDELCTEFSVRWHSAARQAGALYRLAGQQLMWRLESSAIWQTLELPAGALLFPLLRAATGALLPLLAQAERAVVVPCIRDPQSADLFTPLVSLRRTQLLGIEAGNLRRYRYFGGEYGEDGADYWCSAAGWVTAYHWTSAQGRWKVALSLAETEKQAPRRQISLNRRFYI